MLRLHKHVTANKEEDKNASGEPNVRIEVKSKGPANRKGKCRGYVLKIAHKEESCGLHALVCVVGRETNGVLAGDIPSSALQYEKDNYLEWVLNNNLPYDGDQHDRGDEGGGWPVHGQLLVGFGVPHKDGKREHQEHVVVQVLIVGEVGKDGVQQRHCDELYHWIEHHVLEALEGGGERATALSQQFEHALDVLHLASKRGRDAGLCVTQRESDVGGLESGTVIGPVTTHAHQSLPAFIIIVFGKLLHVLYQIRLLFWLHPCENLCLVQHSMEDLCRVLRGRNLHVVDELLEHVPRHCQGDLLIVAPIRHLLNELLFELVDFCLEFLIIGLGAQTGMLFLAFDEGRERVLLQ